ncbi:hypothetical protein [Kitasatospora sp. NPDC059803]|uniref:hypothetical protein n=1 Tax=Kitasatospora sp. NPDC059803 TaxID=3346953 RepID=UPI0036507047
MGSARIGLAQPRTEPCRSVINPSWNPPVLRGERPLADGPAHPAADALAGVTTYPATARITSAELIVLGRDRRMYEWETAARVPLG